MPESSPMSQPALAPSHLSSPAQSTPTTSMPFSGQKNSKQRKIDQATSSKIVKDPVLNNNAPDLDLQSNRYVVCSF